MSRRNAVCLCVDGNMLIPAMFVVDAIKSSSIGTADRFDIILFTGPGDVTDQHRDWMNRRGIIHCQSLDVSGLHDIEILQKRLTSATLSKLLLAGHLEGKYDKLLYLDADLTIHDDVSALFSLDLGDFAMAAVPSARIWADKSEAERITICEHFRALGMTEPYRYINSGVLLIDVANWNRDQIASRALDFIRRNPALCTLPDEDALNAVLDGRQMELSPVWNMRPLGRWRSKTFDIACPVIVHYIGLAKPWKRFSDGKQMFAHRNAYRAYEDFVRGTPWKNWLDDQWSFRDILAGIRFEAKTFRRSLKGKNPAGTRTGRHRYIEAFRRYCADGRFADVEQGIVTREGGVLRLKRSWT